ncbi:unnamed protein product [Lactuca virosa]|uniref:Sacsin/Nov domain-containing protein n=1 Tax=Lactuca virosa TaxID=75947 RepID=A0AAU9NZ37_9ASTR|nr:unnamed protein product [Lactuca virosa]
MAAREHVEEIRRKKFSVGGEPNPLTEDLHQAVKNLSAERYTKDVHFLMELIQNAEDNEYPEEVDPSLEFVITSKDITNTGAPATLLVFNNEKGFLPKNIESICSVGRSTKKGLRKHGYIGEKGIGFKSVFLVTAQPHIFSNGYQIRFNEKPCQQCNLGYIVPEWVLEGDPMLSAIKSIYGLATDLPTTTLVLPLKPEKVKPVKDQLSSLHPEVLLFLSKIRRLSVREDPKLNTLNTISISSEKKIVTTKSKDAESYTLHLTADEADRGCGYYMWKQRFPVKKENKVEVRTEVEEWEITLAFPYGKRFGSSLPGIYSFLPTCTITNFPFIMQADFLLASSRENILWDNKWNQGILDCVPMAFVNAFTSLVKSSTDVLSMFWFLPVNKSHHPKLNIVRDAIKANLMNETIVPCESYNTPQKLFYKPKEVGRLKPAFWSIMNEAMSQGVSFSNILSHDSYIIASSFDKKEYDAILDFLEIQFIDHEWYAKCIGSSNLVMGVSEDIYIQLLLFITQSWESCFYKTNMKNTPLIKYVGKDGNVDLVTPISGRNRLLAADCDHISWLINWNTEFGCSTGKFFLPKVTQEGIELCSEMPTIVAWLKDEVKVSFVSVYEYAELVSRSVHSDRKLAVMYAHFLYTSSQNDYFWKHEVRNLCRDMPIVDKYGQINETRRGVVVPGNGSRWVELIGPNNPWKKHDYVELGEDYNTCDVTYFCDVTSGEKLVSFLKAYDIPNLSPPNAAIPTLASPLTKRNTFLLLEWVRQLRASGFSINLPERFLSSIKNGSWLKIYSGGSTGYGPPAGSFMLDSSIGNLVQYASDLVQFPMVDVQFYGAEIKNYKDELETIGIRFEEMDAFGKRLMDHAKLTKDNFFSVLKFIKHLGGANPTSDLLIKIMRGEKWVRTVEGEMTPGNSVLFSQEEWLAASWISDIPFIDQDYYGEEILCFKDELDLLGVVVKFNQNYQLVVDNVKSPCELGYLPSEAMLLVLECIKNFQSPDKLVDAIRYSRCLMTNLGYNAPYFSFLLNPESQWGCLLQVFESFPLIDEHFYGRSIYSMSNELKKIGVVVDFEHAITKFTLTFENRSSSSIKKEQVLSFLKCYRKLKKLKLKLPVDLKNCIRKKKWLRTRLGDYRSPNECILFSTDWELISSISMLPFIDDTNDFYGSEIHDYRVELKKFGVVTDFKTCAEFLAHGLVLPQDSSTLAPEIVYTLLQSVKELKGKDMILGKFREKLSQKNWLKTYFGYKRPDECLLFSSDWNPFLKCNDGPFIDEGFYGSTIASYKHELSLLGVIVDFNKEGCRLVANHIECHSNFETISRIYNYLSTFKWEPVDQVNTRIWIPRGTDNGEWVMHQDCVLHDKNNLFGEQLNILENSKYDKETLDLFANTLNVKLYPSVEDYCKLWKTWETSGRQITLHECCAFWEFVVQNWYPTTQETFSNNLLKIPVLDPNSNGIFLFDKRDIFIADDLFLTDLFLQSCCYSHPIFAWFPQPSVKSLITRTKLVDIYTKIGVRRLSQSARKNIISDIDEDARHEAVTCVLALEAFESPEKMTARYRLTFSSGDVVDVEPRRMIHWDKQHSKLYMQKKTSSNYKYAIEYASHFAEEIAEGVLLEKEELVRDLSELIRLGYLLDFDEEAVEFLMKTNNLQIFVEDQDYLSSIFSSSKGNLQEIAPGQPPKLRPKKRRRHNSVAFPPSNELQSTKLRRQTSDPCKSVSIYR